MPGNNRSCDLPHSGPLCVCVHRFNKRFSFDGTGDQIGHVAMNGWYFDISLRSSC